MGRRLASSISCSRAGARLARNISLGRLAVRLARKISLFRRAPFLLWSGSFVTCARGSLGSDRIDALRSTRRLSKNATTCCQTPRAYNLRKEKIPRFPKFGFGPCRHGILRESSECNCTYFKTWSDSGPLGTCFVLSYFPASSAYSPPLSLWCARC